jgi:gluconokinase
VNQYILTIDMGTTSTKAFAFLPDGTPIARFHKSYKTFYPQAGYAEQNPDEILIAVKESLSAIRIEVGGIQPLAICFSCAMHGLMAVDETGKPLTQLIIWADNRSNEQAIALRASPQGGAIYKVGGTPIHPMAPVCKILWLRQHAPTIFNRASKFISIKEYLFHHLTGEFVVDYSIASATGLFNTQQLNWNEAALNLCGIAPSKLSRLCDPKHEFFITQSKAAEWGIESHIPLIIGSSDGCLANLGSNALNEGAMAITVGTSGAVRMASQRFLVDAFGRTFCYFLAHDKFIVGGATNNGAVLLNWFTKQLLQQEQSIEDFISDAFSVSKTEGLVFLPYLMGERAPIYNADARGAYVGISISHTQAHFKRALLEGICYALKSIVVSVENTVGPASYITVSGGFVQSGQWVHLLSDVLGKPLRVDTLTDASSVGAAMLGFEAIGKEHTFKHECTKIYYPSAENNAHHNHQYAAFQSLYASLNKEFTTLKLL